MDVYKELERMNNDYMRAREQASKALLLMMIAWFAAVVFAALLLLTCWSNKWQGQTLPQTSLDSSTHMEMILSRVGNGLDIKEVVTVVVT
jgi:hypothetical protein